MVTSFVSSEDGEGGKLFDGASRAEVRSHVIECILMLINAIVGFPDELRHRVQLRAEFIRLQLLDVLGALHRERQGANQRFTYFTQDGFVSNQRNELRSNIAPGIADTLLPQ